MNAIDLLIQDHRHVSRLFGDFKRSSKAETRDRQAAEIIHELSVHAAIEEQFLYPLVRVVADQGSQLARHAIDEHSEIKRHLADLEKSHTEAQVEKVSEAVTHHVEDEESDLLPALRQKVHAQQLERLGSLMEKAKALVPTHPHPLVPGTATAQLLAGPWASVIDHVRDVVNSAA